MVQKSWYQRFFINLFLSPLLLVVLFTLFPLFVVAFVLRTAEALVWNVLDGRRSTNMLTNMWLQISKNPNAHGDINGCMIVAGDLALEKLKTLVTSVFNLKHDNGEKIYWQASRYVRPGYINNYWVEETSYSISDHVVQHPKVVESEEELQDVLRKGTTKENPLKSPWTIKSIPYVTEGVLKTVVHFRVWHGMTDGSSLAYLLMLRLTESDTPLDESQLHMPKYLQIKKLVLYLKAVWSLPAVILETLAVQKDECAFDNTKLTGDKHISWTQQLDVGRIRELKGKLGTSFNDVLLAIINSSLANTLNEAGEYCPTKLSVVIPLNTRLHVQEASEFKNEWTGLILKLPTRQTDLKTNILEMNQMMEEIKQTCKTISSDLLFKIFMYCFIPDFLIDGVIGNACSNVSVATSSIVGPPIRVRLCDQTIEDLMYWAPPAPPIPVCLSVMTYADKLRMVVHCDRALFIDADKITESFEKVFKNLELS